MYRLDEILKEMRERGMNVPELPTRIKIENGTSIMMQYFQYFINQRGETFVRPPRICRGRRNGWRITSVKVFFFMALAELERANLQG
jgi:hypothetical protein